MQHGTFAVVKRRFAPYQPRLRRIADGAEVAPGVRAVAAYGHTPGHTAYHVADGDQQLFIMGDCANRPEVFLRHPGWHFVFDVDGPMASHAQAPVRPRGRRRGAGDRLPLPLSR